MLLYAYHNIVQIQLPLTKYIRSCVCLRYTLDAERRHLFQRGANFKVKQKKQKKRLPVKRSPPTGGFYLFFLSLSSNVAFAHVCVCVCMSVFFLFSCITPKVVRVSRPRVSQ